MILSNYQSFDDWQIAQFGSTNAPAAAADADPDADGANNYLEYLTATSPTNSLDAWKISAVLSDNIVQITFPQIANRAFQVQSTSNLFSPNFWSPLDVAANEPFFSISNRTTVVPDDVSTAPEKFYRVRVIEP